MLDKAIKEAAIAHGDQKRKGKDTPYITHPFSVGMILSQAGYTVDEELPVFFMTHLKIRICQSSASKICSGLTWPT